MTYDATEQGVLGRPVEMYEFIQAGTFTRVTSAATPQTHLGQTYTPLAGLRRTELRQDNEANAGELTVTCPSGFSIAQQFRGTLPSSLPNLTIFAKHLNDGDDEGVVIFKGVVISSNVTQPRLAQLKCLPPTRLFQTTIPRAVFSATCNNQLYDPQCGVVRDNYRYEGVVTSISSDGFILTINGLRAGAAAIDAALSLGLSSGELDNFWQRGNLRVGTPIETRMVVETVVGNVDTFRVSKPFRQVEIGNVAEIFAGCNHSTSHCNAKFKNFVTPGVAASGLKFGGFPYVPTNNPFEIELDRGIQQFTFRGITVRL